MIMIYYEINKWVAKTDNNQIRVNEGKAWGLQLGFRTYYNIHVEAYLGFNDVCTNACR